MSARIETFPPQILTSRSGNSEPMFTASKAVLEDSCDCVVFTGLRVDNREPACVVAACSEEHFDKMEHFLMLLKLSLADPQDRPLIDVVCELLDETDRNWKPLDDGEL